MVFLFEANALDQYEVEQQDGIKVALAPRVTLIPSCCSTKMLKRMFAGRKNLNLTRKEWSL